MAAFGALFAARMAAGMMEAGANLPMGEGAILGPQTLAALSPDQQAAIAQAVIHALNPIYLIAAALAAIAFVFAFLLQEVQLTNRHVPKGE